MSLEAIIKQQIRDNGPMSVADYMSLCLAHPEHGYYMKRDPFGVDGDFTTAPEISQIFGELIGLWLAAQWQKQGSKKAILCELGPGRGTLCVDMLRATKKIAGFHDAISLHLLEISPVLKQKQWKNLAGKHAELHWHETFDELPPLPLFFVANEFFDALPIHQFVDAVERMIGVDDNDNLCFVIANEQSERGDPSWIASATPRNDNVKEKSPASIAVMNQLAEHIKQYGGGGLIIDYGYTGGTHGDTLQALKNHNYHELLETPGEADLTAHVDFDALAQAATDVAVYGAIPQGKFLLQIGASQRLMTLCQNANEQQRPHIMSGFERLISHEQMGELFKVLALLPADSPKPEGF